MASVSMASVSMAALLLLLLLLIMIMMMMMMVMVLPVHAILAQLTMLPPPYSPTHLPTRSI